MSTYFVPSSLCGCFCSRSVAQNITNESSKSDPNMGLGCSPGSGFEVYLRFPQLFHALGKCIASSRIMLQAK